MDDAQALKEKARTLEHSGQDQAALDLYSRIAAQAAEPDPGVLVRMGNLQLRLGRAAEAASTFARSAALLADSGLRNGALALFHRVVGIDPAFTPALLQLGELSAREGYLEDAGAWLRRYCERTEQEGDPGAGWDAVRRYLEAYPGDTSMRRFLAERLMAHGRAEEARALEPKHAAPAEPAPAPPADPGELPPLVPDAATEDDGLPVMGNSWEGSDLPAEGGVAPREELGILPTRMDDAGAEPDVAPLEGLEPTRLEGLEPTDVAAEWSREEPAPERVEPLSLLGSAPYDAAEDPAGGAGEDGAGWAPPADGFDLPLLGARADAGPGADRDADPLPRLTDRLAREPGDLDVHHELIALLQQRGESGLLAAALEAAHPAFAAAGRYAEATDLTSELIALRPDAVELLAQRVEYALASGDDARSVAALLALGRRLDARADPQGARQIFSRVLRLDPSNEEAARALAALQPPDEPDFLDPPSPRPSRDPDGSTRARVSVDHPSGDDDRDFAEILDHFRRQVSEQIDPADAESHFDLGVAFKEMGLLDDAVQQLQIALLGGARAVATLEVLGECYLEKGEPALAARVFRRATRVPSSDEGALVGVRYGLGRCEEALGNPEAARAEYERVVAVEPRFRDAAARLDALRP